MKDVQAGVKDHHNVERGEFQAIVFKVGHVCPKP